jgi:outer membrane protein assembly factor BamD (BamD/ComL family)
LANFNENEEITLSTTEKKASELFDKGNDLFNSGKYEDAINLYNEVLFDPNYVSP